MRGSWYRWYLFHPRDGRDIKHQHIVVDGLELQGWWQQDLSKLFDLYWRYNLPGNSSVNWPYTGLTRISQGCHFYDCADASLQPTTHRSHLGKKQRYTACQCSEGRYKSLFVMFVRRHTGMDMTVGGLSWKEKGVFCTFHCRPRLIQCWVWPHAFLWQKLLFWF